MDWISVEDRLPENGELVLVAHKSGISIARCNVFKPNGKAYWTGYRGRSHSLATVTYWMPLPECPKKNKGGK